jgi:hypothetical protein
MNEVQERCTTMVYSETFWRAVRMNDDLIERLGRSQQQVMSLTVQNRQLRDRAEKAEYRAEVLEELVMDVVADLQDNLSADKIERRIRAVIQRLDAND